MSAFSSLSIFFSLFDTWDFQWSAPFKAHLIYHDLRVPGVWLPRDSGVLPPDHSVQHSRFSLLPRIWANDLGLYLEAGF